MNTKTKAPKKAKPVEQENEFYRNPAQAKVGLIEMDTNKAEKRELYYIYHDGKGVPHKIADLTNPIVCKQRGVIKIEALRRGAFKQADITFCTSYDKISRVIFGVPLGIDPITNKIIYKRFRLPEFKVLNLSNQDEAEEWAILKRHEIITGVNGRQLYKVIDEEEQAKEETTRILLVKEAVSIAEKMKLKEWVPAVRFLFPGNERPENMSPTVLENRIYSVARDNPSELINYWRNEHREYIDLLEGAKAVGLVHHDYQNGWLFDRKMPMGSTWDDALRFLIKDHQFVKSLSDKVKSMDVSLQMILGENKKKSMLEDSDSEEGKALNDLRFKARMLGITGTELMTDKQLKARIAAEEKIVLGDDESVEFVEEME